MKIKPFKKPPSLPPNFESDSWKRLSSAVTSIFEKKPLLHSTDDNGVTMEPLSREQLYRNVEDCCVHKFGPTIYNKLQALIDKHLSISFTNLGKKYVDEDGDSASSFLQSLDLLWQDYCLALSSIRNIFLYLDRSYVLQHNTCAVGGGCSNNNNNNNNSNGVVGIWEMGINVFRRFFIQDKNQQSSTSSNNHRHQISSAHHSDNINSICNQCITSLISQITDSRNGASTNYSILRSQLRMLTSLNLYTSTFHPTFIKSSKTFFIDEAEKMIHDEGFHVPTYLGHVNERLTSSIESSSLYLDLTSRAPLLKAVENGLLLNHTTFILEKGFSNLLDNERIADLGLLYTLFSRVSKTQEIKTCLNEYTREKVKSIIQVSDERRVSSPNPPHHAFYAFCFECFSQMLFAFLVFQYMFFFAFSGVVVTPS